MRRGPVYLPRPSVHRVLSVVRIARWCSDYGFTAEATAGFQYAGSADATSSDG
jgi:hypothetical protein